MNPTEKRRPQETFPTAAAAGSAGAFPATARGSGFPVPVHEKPPRRSRAGWTKRATADATGLPFDQYKGISEAASEKRKRGRPKIMGASSERMADFVAPDVKSVRGRQEVYYRTVALSVLTKDKRFSWLADEAAMKAGAGRWKPSILSELGRVSDTEDMKNIATRICELTPKTKEAVSMIRRYRLGREAPSDAWKLFQHLAAAVDAYRERHPSTPNAALIEGLQDMAGFIKDEDGGTV